VAVSTGVGRGVGVAVGVAVGASVAVAVGDTVADVPVLLVSLHKLPNVYIKITSRANVTPAAANTVPYFFQALLPDVSASLSLVFVTFMLSTMLFTDSSDIRMNVISVLFLRLLYNDFVAIC
jgi:hypothetical protein